MKTFIFSLTSTPNRGLPGYTKKARIYRVKKNTPVYIGNATWDTCGSFDDSTNVQRFLAKMKKIPMIFKTENYSHNNPNFRIEEV
jgi:hypothetical protein